MDNAKTILIVDDEQDMREMLAYEIAASGYRVETAKDGFDALDVMEEITPDLILLDMRMPNMNGFEFYKKMSEIRKEIPCPILVLTAEENTDVLFQEFNVEAYLAKPFRMETLLHTIEVVIKTSSVNQRSQGDER